MKKLFAYILGALALAVPFCVMMVILAPINYTVFIVTMAICQIAYITSIEMLTRESWEEIKMLRKELGR